MPRRGQTRPKRAVGDLADPRGFARMVERYVEWMRMKGYSETTVIGRKGYLAAFARWCEERSVTRPSDVTKPVVDRYARHLYHYRQRTGAPLTMRSQHKHLVSVRAFFKWLAKENLILYNPASELELPKLEHRLPKHVLSVSEAERILNQPDVAEPFGLRDRALLEVLYSTGIRRAELAGLKLYDLDVERGTLIVRQGKGKKDRMIPIGDRAIAWVDAYLEAGRPSLVVEPDEGFLFLTYEGLGMTPGRLTQLVRGYVQAADIHKTGACHLFRHTMATLMLEGGADIRFIQQMLGHAKLDTTQIYTQVSIRKLKEIHTATHPGARLRRAVVVDRLSVAGPDRNPSPTDSDNQEPTTENQPQGGLSIVLDEPTADDVLSSLAAEIEDDPEREC